MNTTKASAVDEAALLDWAARFESERTAAVARAKTVPEFQAWASEQEARWTEDECADRWVRDRGFEYPAPPSAPAWATTHEVMRGHDELFVTWSHTTDAARVAQLTVVDLENREVDAQAPMVQLLGREENILLNEHELDDAVATIRSAQALLAS